MPELNYGKILEDLDYVREKIVDIQHGEKNLAERFTNLAMTAECCLEIHTRIMNWVAENDSEIDESIEKTHPQKTKKRKKRKKESVLPSNSVSTSSGDARDIEISEDPSPLQMEEE